MKKLTILLLLVMVSALLLFTACAKDDDDVITGIPDITPANFDWDITIMDADFKAANYMVWADWLGNSSAIDVDDEFTLEIDGTSHDLMGGYDDGDWSFFMLADLSPGTQYNMVFKKNGSQLASQTVKVPYEANATFPNNFDPTKTAHATWQLTGNNKYQGVSLFSNDNDEYYKNIAVSDRSFTFPKNAVKVPTTNAGYGMMIQEANFEKSGRVAFSSMSFTMQEYGAGVSAKFETSNLRKIAKNIRQIMQ